MLKLYYLNELTRDDMARLQTLLCSGVTFHYAADKTIELVRNGAVEVCLICLNPDCFELNLSDTSFTPRQREALAQLVEGKSNKEIGQALGISEKTVEHHVSVILEKLGLKSRAQVIRFVGGDQWETLKNEP